MRAAQEIREHIQEELVTGMAVKAGRSEDKAWLEGIPGVILESRLNLLAELLLWIDEGGEELPEKSPYTQ